MASLLYGIGATDAGAYMFVTVVVLATASLASYLQARRSMRVDTMVA